MKILSAFKHQPIECPSLSDIHLSLVNVALPLVFSAHMATKALTVFECYVAQLAGMYLLPVPPITTIVLL